MTETFETFVACYTHYGDVGHLPLQAVIHKTFAAPVAAYFSMLRQNYSFIFIALKLVNGNSIIDASAFCNTFNIPVNHLHIHFWQGLVSW